MFLSLLIRHLRQCWAFTLAAWFAALTSVLFVGEPVRYPGSVGLLITVWIHVAVMVMILGRSAPQGTGFLYSLGYTRDQLWWSALASTVISAVLVCAGLWIALTLGLRSWIQEMAGNPWYPLLKGRDAGLCWPMLTDYLWLIPAAHFIWIRSRVPSPDAGLSWLLGGGLILLALVARDSAYREWNWGWITGWRVLLMGVLIAMCWRLHRNVEVRA